MNDASGEDEITVENCSLPQIGKWAVQDVFDGYSTKTLSMLRNFVAGEA